MFQSKIPGYEQIPLRRQLAGARTKPSLLPRK
jgi:hypothetical protein